MRPRLTLAIGCLLAAVSLWPAARLGIRSDVEAMLPNGTPAAEAYRAFLGTFGGIERAYVTIRLPDGVPADPDRLADAAETLADALAASPEVARVRYALDASDEAFATAELAPRLPLLLGEHAPESVAAATTPGALAARVDALRDAAEGPAALFLSSIASADPLGLAEHGLRGLSPGSALPFDPVTGVLLSKDQRAVLIVVTPKRGEADAEGGRALSAALDAAYAAVRKEQGGDLVFDAIGGPLYAVHDEAALKDDLVRILTAAGVVVLLMIVVAFEGISIPAISIAAVAIGQLWCAALVALALGNVTAVGVGFAAILLGLGDDFTIHLGARFREIWASGQEPRTAMMQTVDETWPGISTAAFTTAMAFACLGLAHFRPLRELGLVVAVGVLLSLAATFWSAGPMLILVSRLWKRVRAPRWRGFGWFVTWGVRAGGGFPRASLAACALLTLASIVGVTRLSLDTDMRRLRPSDHPAARAEERLVKDFGIGLDTSTITVEGRDVDRALDRAAAVASIVRERYPDAEIVTPSDWLVQGDRLAARVAALRPLGLDAAAQRLSVALDGAGLNVHAFDPALDVLRGIADGKAPPPIAPAKWPDWIADGIREGPQGTAVAVRVRMPADAWPLGPPAALLDAIEKAAPGAKVANAKRLGAELRNVAVRDLERLGSLAIAVVLGLVAFSYRGNVAATALTFLPVVLGTAWTAGLWGALGLPLDLFSLCVLPVMVGIGVDDGLHVMHLARQRGEDLERAALDAGRGVVLTNLTTCAGFAALALSHVPALRNGGLLICTGNLLCLVATLVVLPAVARLKGSR